MRVNVNSKFTKSYSPNSEFDNKKKKNHKLKYMKITKCLLK